MIVFWITAALMSALIASLVLLRAASAAARPAVAEDPSLGVYRRQLSEIDELADRGLLPGGEVRLARAEAARRLLGAAARQPQDGDVIRPARDDRRWVLAAAAVAILAAVGLYFGLGSAGAPDQPYRQRLATWRAADPSTLDPPRMAAVVGAIVAEHPGKVLPLYYLAQAQMAAGEPFQAEHSLRQALVLAPNRAELWTALGELLTAEARGEPSGASGAAFERALAINPKAAIPRYNLALARVRKGDVPGGLAALRALAADLTPTDPNRKALEAQIREIAKAGAAPTPPATPEAGAPAGTSAGGDQQAFIRSMVDRLATRLNAQPDDPAGWGRLIRAYTVLGDDVRRRAAESRAQSLFKARPDALAALRRAQGGAQ